MIEGPPKRIQPRGVLYLGPHGNVDICSGVLYLFHQESGYSCVDPECLLGSGAGGSWQESCQQPTAGNQKLGNNRPMKTRKGTHSKALKTASRSSFARLRWVAFNIRNHKDDLIPNSSQLAMEWECSLKTIHRDLDLLRNFFNYPIFFDSSNNGWKVMGTLPEAVL